MGLLIAFVPSNCMIQNAIVCGMQACSGGSTDKTIQDNRNRQRTRTQDRPSHSCQLSTTQSRQHVQAVTFTAMQCDTSSNHVRFRLKCSTLNARPTSCPISSIPTQQRHAKCGSGCRIPDTHFARDKQISIWINRIPTRLDRCTNVCFSHGWAFGEIRSRCFQ